MVFAIRYKSSAMEQGEFERLSENRQVDILYHDGVYIGKQKGFCSTLLLFQLESFYVEIRYSNYRRTIKGIHCSGSTMILEPYLDQIHFW